jgi:hypothetical protein
LRCGSFITFLLQTERGAVRGARTEVFGEIYGNENAMPLIQIVVALIAVGVLLWLMNSFIPMAGNIKKLLNWVVIITVVVWLMNVSGMFHYLSGIRVG